MLRPSQNSQKKTTDKSVVGKSIGKRERKFVYINRIRGCFVCVLLYRIIRVVSLSWITGGSVITSPRLKRYRSDLQRGSTPSLTHLRLSLRSYLCSACCIELFGLSENSTFPSILRARSLTFDSALPKIRLRIKRFERGFNVFLDNFFNSIDFCRNSVFFGIELFKS